MAIRGTEKILTGAMGTIRESELSLPMTLQEAMVLLRLLHQARRSSLPASSDEVTWTHLLARLERAMIGRVPSNG